jgi:Metallopeptidase toxin 2
MGNILKGLSEILSGNGNIIDALTGSQAGSDTDIFNLMGSERDSSNPKKQGNSHVFDMKGNFLRSQSMAYEPSETNRGSNVYVEKEDKSLVLLTDFTITAENAPALSKVFYSYATSVKIPMDGGRIVGLKEKPKDGNRRGIMFAEGTDIHINSEGGKFDNSLSDYYNIRNSLIHEYNHTLNFEKKINDAEEGGYFEHAKVYFEQIKHETFKKCTIELQEGVINSMTSNYLSKCITEMGLQFDDIQKFVDQVNVVLLGYKKELIFHFFIDFSRDTNPPYTDFTFKILRKK